MFDSSLPQRRPVARAKNSYMRAAPEIMKNIGWIVLGWFFFKGR